MSFWTIELIISKSQEAKKMFLIKMLAKLNRHFRMKKCIKNGLQLGKDTIILTNPANFGSEPYLIKIGDNCAVAEDVRFITHDGGTWVFRRRKELCHINKYGKIEIKDNCMIGLGSIILPNVTIGPNTVIGAGSVVGSDIPPDVCAAGNPAKVFCSLEEYIKKSEHQSIKFPESYRSKREVLEKHFWGKKR
jgi:acetyltransferase-like isoleucine patch superfamily enzyme